MGIFAKGSRFPANVEADTPQNRYGGQFTKDFAAGDALGETIGNVNSTASSANTTAGEIIKDIEALEGRVDALEKTVVYLSFERTITGWQWLRPSSPWWEPTTYNFTVPPGDYHVVVENAYHTSIGLQFNGLPVDERVIKMPDTKWHTFDISLPSGSAVQSQDAGGEVGERLNVLMIPTRIWEGLSVESRRENEEQRKYVDQQITAIGTLTSTSGTGWQAWRRNGVTTLTFTGITEGFTLPDGYRPAVVVHGLFSYTGGSVGARFVIRPEGGVTLVGDIPNLAYGTITFVSPN